MRILIGILACLLGGAAAGRAGVLDVLFPTPELQVITVTDFAPGALPLRPPTLAAPVYYLGVCAGYHDWGGAIAGDKLPKKEDMIRVIAKVLAKQGYLPADAMHPPTQLIFFAWGTLYPVLFGGNPSFPVQMNRRQELAFLGGTKLRIPEAQAASFPEIEGLTFRTPDQEDLYEAAREELYVAKIAGYALDAGRQKHPKPLWVTRISCFARRRVMADTLPTMVIIAGPNVARDTIRPVWTRASNHFKAEVKLGEPRLEEFLDSNQLPVVDLSAAHAKAGR